ncbi:unnamed protein product, partial [Ectocarpus sp. 6 AP-2014]
MGVELGIALIRRAPKRHARQPLCLGLSCREEKHATIKTISRTREQFAAKTQPTTVTGLTLDIRFHHEWCMQPQAKTRISASRRLRCLTPTLTEAKA